MVHQAGQAPFTIGSARAKASASRLAQPGPTPGQHGFKPSDESPISLEVLERKKKHRESVIHLPRRIHVSTIHIFVWFAS